MKTKRNCWEQRALTLSDTLIVIATIGLIGLILLPALVPRRSCGTAAARISCVNNLKQVGLAFRIYANDNDDLYPPAIPNAHGGAMDSVVRGDVSRVLQVMSNELSIPRTLNCPADSREEATNFTDFGHAHISYFVGLDAVDTKPDMILSGDRDIAIKETLLTGAQNLTHDPEMRWASILHEHGGNIGMADGSVQQVNTTALYQALKNSGDTNNRVIFPQ